MRNMLTDIKTFFLINMSAAVIHIQNLWTSKYEPVQITNRLSNSIKRYPIPSRSRAPKVFDRLGRVVISAFTIPFFSTTFAADFGRVAVPDP